MIKGKGVPSSINEGWVPGGDPGPEPSPLQVAFSRAGAIQRLGDRSIRRTCSLPSQFLNTATRYTDESQLEVNFLLKEIMQQPTAESILHSFGYESRPLPLNHRVFL